MLCRLKSSWPFPQKHGKKFAYMARGLENDAQPLLPVSGAAVRKNTTASRNLMMIIRADSMPLRKFKEKDVTGQRE